MTCEASRKTYVRLSRAQWDEAARRHLSGLSRQAVADLYGVSLRAAEKHIPVAMARVQRADQGAASKSSPGAVASVIRSSPSLEDDEALPPVAERKLAAAYWRQRTWQDAMLMRGQMLAAVSQSPPDHAALRALKLATEISSRISGQVVTVLDLKRDEPDMQIPELVIRRMTDDEVAEIRAQQKRDDEELGISRTELAELMAEVEYEADQMIQNQNADDPDGIVTEDENTVLPSRRVLASVSI